MPTQRLSPGAVLIAATSLIAACLVGIVDASPAYALSCETFTRNLAGIDDVGQSYLGVKGNFYPQAFTTSQCITVRSMEVSGSSGGNIVEFGWFVQSGTGPHVPFAVWQVDGAYHEHDNPGGLGNFGNSSTYHTFELVNANQNTYWAYNYDGTSLESHQVAGLSNGGYFAAGQTERHNGNDDLHAHFQALKDCRVIDNCNFLGFGNLSFTRTPSGADPSWVFCRDSSTAFHVTLNTCP